MVKISEMSYEDRRRMVSEMTTVMSYNYRIDIESIEEFWETVELGIEVKKKA